MDERKETLQKGEDGLQKGTEKRCVNKPRLLFLGRIWSFILARPEPSVAEEWTTRLHVILSACQSIRYMYRINNGF